MKGSGAFLVIVIGLLLLWLVLSGRAANLSAAGNALFNGTGALPVTKTMPGGGGGGADMGNASAGTYMSYAPPPGAPIVAPPPNPQSYLPGSYLGASYVDPNGSVYA